MGFLKKKIYVDEYMTASSKINEPIHSESARERIAFEEPKNPDLGSKYADMLMKGIPLVIYFEYISIDDANKIIAFLAGVLYSIGGEVHNVKDKVFLFARSQEFMDGTLNEFLSEI